ncbi:hypothetical protein GQX74_013500 [Glossina fuscipes]|nr:hypothetical protein GQX74_013500 [Glossina fuscipes]
MLPLSATRSSRLETSSAEATCESRTFTSTCSSQSQEVLPKSVASSHGTLSVSVVAQKQTQYDCLSRANNQNTISPSRQTAVNKSTRNPIALDAGNASGGHYKGSTCAADKIFDILLGNADSPCVLNIIYELHDVILKKSPTRI